MNRKEKAKKRRHALYNEYRDVMSLNIKEQQGRTVIVAPSIVPVGEYFQDAYGVSTRAGTLSMLVNADGWTDLTLL